MIMQVIVCSISYLSANPDNLIDLKEKRKLSISPYKYILFVTNFFLYAEVFKKYNLFFCFCFLYR